MDFVEDELDLKVLKLFYNDYNNIEDISELLNISGKQVEEILEKYCSFLKDFPLEYIMF